MRARDSWLEAGRRLALPVFASALLLLPPRAVLAQTGALHEYELKAGVLFHIIEYVQWPAGAIPNDPPTIQIGLLGQIQFANAFEVLDGKIIQGRKLVVRQLSDPAEALKCQVLFVAASEKPRLGDLLGQVRKHPILTVGELEGFAENGGIVNLLASQNRIVMEINRETAGESRLSISSQLLKLAKLVSRRP